MAEPIFQHRTQAASLLSLLIFLEMELSAWFSHGMEQHNPQVNMGLYFKSLDLRVSASLLY